MQRRRTRPERRRTTLPQHGQIDDAALVTSEVTPAGDGKILLLACGALAREILAVTKGNGWDHLDLHCLPAILHNAPDRIPDAVEHAVKKYQQAYQQIFVVYADCGTGGVLKQRCAELGVEMMAGPHCYSFYEGNDAFADHSDEITAFYLTDFLVRQFDAFITQPLSLDRNPELREMYFGNYTKLVYQSQIEDPLLLEKAKYYAEFLQLEFEHRPTGYGDLQTELAALKSAP